PETCFFLSTPCVRRRSVGVFFFWGGAAITRESSSLQSPSDRREWGGGETGPAPSPRQEPEPRVGVNLAPEEALRLPEPRSIPVDEAWSEATRTNLSILSAPPPKSITAGIPGWRWLLVPILLAIAALAGFFMYRCAAVRT